MNVIFNKDADPAEEVRAAVVSICDMSTAEREQRFGTNILRHILEGCDVDVIVREAREYQAAKDAPKAGQIWAQGDKKCYIYDANERTVRYVYKADYNMIRGENETLVGFLAHSANTGREAPYILQLYGDMWNRHDE